jgi:diaminopimelate epimerase
VANLQVSDVNTGIPHAVIFVEDLDLPLTEIAPLIRHNDIFPADANLNLSSWEIPSR